jgi:hypothetical protein
MHQTFVAELVKDGRRFLPVSGSREERLAVATGAVRELLVRCN